MPHAGAKRFYKRAETSSVPGGFGIELDGRAVRTPAGDALLLPTQALAEAVRDEWQAQADVIKPESMPMMQLSCTAWDRVVPNRDVIIGQTATYGATDLLCYFSDKPDELVRRQREGWQPLLDWAAAELSAPLETANGILHIAQPEASLVALKAEVAALDDWSLTAVAQLTQVLGSLVLALAIARGRLSAGEAFRLSVIDDNFQAERWGEDREALQRLRGLEREVDAAVVFLGLARA
jgi:chaperone required for assembly of F1-ATPase